jgi:DNA polymerase-3 subunit beta
MTTTTPNTTTIKSSRSRTTMPASQPAAEALIASVQQADLKRGLALITHAVAAKSTLPVLSHVLLESVGSGRLRLSATNLEIGILASVVARIEQPGAIALPAKLLADVVGSLPNEPISLAMDARTQSITLRCARFEATIKGLDAEEFPTIPRSDEQPPTALFVPEALCCAVAQVAFAAASDDTRPILTGVRIALMGARAVFAAADTFRLACREISLDREVAQAQEVVVPATAMRTLGKLLADSEGPVEMRIDAGDRVSIRTEELELVARVIDGAYPNIDKYLELSVGTRAELSVKELAKAVKLASFFAVSSANIIKLLLSSGGEGNGTLTLSANAAEVGSNISQHDIAIDGQGGVVALNAAFLAEGIAAIATLQIAIHYRGAQLPVVLRGVGDESYIYVAMPMTVR